MPQVMADFRLNTKHYAHFKLQRQENACHLGIGEPLRYNVEKTTRVGKITTYRQEMAAVGPVGPVGWDSGLPNGSGIMWHPGSRCIPDWIPWNLHEARRRWLQDDCFNIQRST